MEMKAGDGALASHIDRKTGKKLPGLVKHVEDIERFLTPARRRAVSGRYALLCEEMKEVYAAQAAPSTQLHSEANAPASDRSD